MTRVLLSLALLAMFAIPEVACAAEPVQANSLEKLLFSRHVVPLCSRLGCDAGACHGSVNHRNGAGRDGLHTKDQQGTCQSVLVAGGGFAGGAVVGATNKHAAYVVDKYYQVESFGRTIYHLLGIYPDQTLYALDNRPHRLIGEDTPLIKEALA